MKSMNMHGEKIKVTSYNIYSLANMIVKISEFLRCVYIFPNKFFSVSISGLYVSLSSLPIPLTHTCKHDTQLQAIYVETCHTDKIGI